MCDCYVHPCKVCGKKIPMHLGGYLTGRDEIEVYCWKHARRLDRTVIWHIGDAEERIKRELPELYESDKKFVGKDIAVRSLTDNAWSNRMGNHPNLVLDMEPEEVDPALEMERRKIERALDEDLEKIVSRYIKEATGARAGERASWRLSSAFARDIARSLKRAKQG